MAPIQSAVSAGTGFDYWDAICNGINLGLNAIVAIGVMRKMYKRWSNSGANESEGVVREEPSLPGPRPFVNPRPTVVSSAGIPDAVAALAATSLGSAIQEWERPGLPEVEPEA